MGFFFPANEDLKRIELVWADGFRQNLAAERWPCKSQASTSYVVKTCSPLDNLIIYINSFSCNHPSIHPFIKLQWHGPQMLTVIMTGELLQATTIISCMPACMYVCMHASVHVLYVKQSTEATLLFPRQHQMQRKVPQLLCKKISSSYPSMP
jgi:hypothetical protein